MPPRNQRGENSDLPAGLASPALRALAAAGITRMDDFTRMTEAELRKLHGMGPKAIGLIRTELKASGRSFAGPGDPR